MSQPQSIRIQITCQNCGKVFPEIPAKHDKKYCGNDCKYQAQEKTNEWPEPNPSGLCMCGCGQPTTISWRSSKAKGWVKGKPRRLIHGHQYPSKVNKVFPENYVVDPVTGCWNWSGCKNSKGYGRIRIDGALLLAHRASYMSTKGDIPEDLVLDHLCCNPSCVNPDHLEAVTRAVNNERALAAKSHHGDGL